jgi:hypothetical protein
MPQVIDDQPTTAFEYLAPMAVVGDTFPHNLSTNFGCGEVAELSAQATLAIRATATNSVKPLILRRRVTRVSRSIVRCSASHCLPWFPMCVTRRTPRPEIVVRASSRAAQRGPERR